MKKLLFLLLLSLPIFCHAQTDTTAYQKKIAYCIVGIGSPSRKYVVATLFDGTAKKTSDIEIKDSQGKQIKFTTVIDVLDYVTQQGWTLVSSYYAGAQYFVFKKPVATNTH
jgi:hypothetical protein